VLMSVSPWIGLLAFGIWLVLLLIFRYISISSITCMVIAPFFVFMPHFGFFYLVSNNWYSVGFFPSDPFKWILFSLLYLNSLIIIYRHKPNLINLKNKQEKKFF
jgi:glycerol-3-phosphate acyltransferase PlsY